MFRYFNYEFVEGRPEEGGLCSFPTAIISWKGKTKQQKQNKQTKHPPPPNTNQFWERKKKLNSLEGPYEGLRILIWTLEYRLSPEEMEAVKYV